MGSPPLTYDELVEEMLDFGMDLETAEHMAPAMLPLFNDPRGLGTALIENSPRLAEQLGIVRRQ